MLKDLNFTRTTFLFFKTFLRISNPNLVSFDLGLEPKTVTKFVSNRNKHINIHIHIAYDAASISLISFCLKVLLSGIRAYRRF